MLATFTRNTRTATTLPQVVAVRPHFFASIEHVEMAADCVREFLAPAPDVTMMRGRSVREVVHALRLGDRYTIDLAPGVIALKKHERRSYEEEQVDMYEYMQGKDNCVELDDFDRAYRARKGRVITEWSRPSRARFHRRMAELDYSVWEGQRLGMVTLTLPHHWERIAPTGAAFKDLLDAFRARWERATGRPLHALWKQEFQRRGAPHVHLLVAIPDTIGGLRAAEWIGWNWVDVCAPVGADRGRMLKAHLPSTNRPHGVIDHSPTSTDPKRIAVYFGKHSAKTGDGKEYQHTVPALWQAPGAGPGRFWGYWSLQRAVVQVECSQEDFFRARRILAHVARARAARHALSLRAAARINGESLRRATLETLKVRKSRLFKGHGGGWVLTNDGLLTAYDLARALAPPS